MTDENREAVESISRALADSTRIEIFNALRRGAHSVGELAQALGRSADRLYYHLDKLEEAGIVTLQSTRPKRIYQLVGAIADDLATQPTEDLVHHTSAVLEVARIEAEQALRQNTRKRGFALISTTASLSHEEIAELRQKVAELLVTVASATSLHRKRTRVVFVAYPSHQQ